MRLEARGVTVRYGGARGPALEQVDCAVEPEGFVAIVGPNGSGKTSLTRALLGRLPLVEGEVTLDGRGIDQWDRRALAREIGVVTQREDTPFPIRVREAVMMGRYPRLGALRAPALSDLAVVERSLARCDVADLADRPVETLSGGEWQRVRVARALAQEPRLLVLDEPSAALDLRHEMELFELIERLVRDGLGALVVSHHLNVAARFADRVVLLSGGRVAAAGAPDEVFRTELLAPVFGWPISVGAGPDGRPQVTPLRREGTPA